MIKKTKGKGSLPEHCPSCNADADWEWEDYEPETLSQRATCLVCGDAFFEIYKIINWEKDEIK